LNIYLDQQKKREYLDQQTKKKIYLDQQIKENIYLDLQTKFKLVNNDVYMPTSDIFTPLPGG